MQVINQLSKLNCFNSAVGKIIIKNFIAHNDMRIKEVGYMVTVEGSEPPLGCKHWLEVGSQLPISFYPLL